MIFEKGSQSKCKGQGRYDKRPEIEDVDEVEIEEVNGEIKGQNGDWKINPHIEQISQGMNFLRKTKNKLITSELLISLDNKNGDQLSDSWKSNHPDIHFQQYLHDYCNNNIPVFILLVIYLIKSVHA